VGLGRACSEILFGKKKNEKSEKNPPAPSLPISYLWQNTLSTMNDTRFLSPEQVRFFEENGYLLVPDFLSLAQCEKLIGRAAELVEELRPEWDAAVFSTREQTRTSNDYFLSSGDKVRVFMEEAGDPDGSAHRVNKIGHAMHDLDPVFRAFPRAGDLEAIARDIGIKKTGLMQSMYIFKQPKIGGEVSVHQDATFLYTEPLSVVGFWFGLQDATQENGCLWALPGGHKEGLKTRFKRDGAGGTCFEVLDERPLPTEGYVPLEVRAGTLVLLHGLLPHYSEANRSLVPRQAYAIHVVDQQTHYPAENWLQRAQSLPVKGWKR
jgi:phytanoyl-CoA hydroxylase